MDDLQSNEYYYEPRAHYSFYETIYKDYEAMNTFQQALSFNPLQIRDKVVLDIGSGPGVFSLLAARAGARRVYAWEPTIQSEHSKKIIRDNGFENVITILSGQIESIALLEQVDVIFTSSIGFSFYLGSLLPAFIYAKDHYLKPDGVLLPSSYSISIATYSPASSLPKSSFWKNVYGFDFTPIESDTSKSPFYCWTPKSRIKTTTSTIFHSDFMDENREHFAIRNSEFELQMEKDGEISGFLLWFALKFSIGNRIVVLDCSPWEHDKHWAQICLPFASGLNLKCGDKIKGRISMVPEDLKMKVLLYVIEFSVNGGDLRREEYVYRV
jgi:protein arginine N-methyltransferase 1